jgi:hypothetical protein
MHCSGVGVPTAAPVLYLHILARTISMARSPKSKHIKSAVARPARPRNRLRKRRAQLPRSGLPGPLHVGNCAALHMGDASHA